MGSWWVVRTAGAGGQIAASRRFPAAAVAVAVAVVSAVAGYDAVAHPGLALLSIMAVGPCLAAVAAGPVAVAAVGGYSVLLIVVVSGWVGPSGTAHQVVELAGQVVVTCVAVVIAAGRRAMRARAERDERRHAGLAAIVESSDDAIVAKSLDGTITAWNPGAERMYGYRADEAIGQNITMVMRAEDVTGLTRLLDRIAAGQRVDHYETRRLRKDGTVIDVSVTVSPIRDRRGRVIGASATARDVTARKQAEHNRAMLAAIVLSSNDAIGAFARDGTITAWNPGAERMYGYSAAEAIGRNISMLINPAEVSELPRILSLVGSGAPVSHYEATRVRKDGAVIDVSVTISPIRDQAGAVSGASFTCRDITAAKQAQAHQQQMRERSAQAERLQSLGQLAGGIAHDFNNLLAIILNYTGFVADQIEHDPAVRADLDKIRAAVERAGRLTHQLLTFARREPARVDVFDLNDLITDAQRLLGRTIGEHINLVTLPAPEPLLIKADRGQIEQVLLNLALNARDAMPQGGTMVIEANATELDEATAGLHPVPRPGRYARLLVSDTGVGMSREVAARVFEPFFTTKAKGQGTGLGLATVYGVVTESGGSIKVYSEPNVGTTMRAYLPAVQQPTGGQPSLPAAAPARGGGQTILVVEDEDPVRELVVRILDGHGYAVMAASRGAAALVLANEHRFDLLLTDIIMPEMSGRELADRLRVTQPLLPVLFMSGYSDGLLSTRGILHEGVELIQKPFTARDLLHHVQAVLAAAVANPAARP